MLKLEALGSILSDYSSLFSFHNIAETVCSKQYKLDCMLYMHGSLGVLEQQLLS